MSVYKSYNVAKEFYGKAIGNCIGRWWADTSCTGDGTGGTNTVKCQFNDAVGQIQRDQWFTLKDWAIHHGDVVANVGTNWAVYLEDGCWQDAMNVAIEKYITGRSDSWEHYTHTNLYCVSVNKNKHAEIYLGRMAANASSVTLELCFQCGSNVNTKVATVHAWGYIYKDMPCLSDAKW